MHLARADIAHHIRRSKDLNLKLRDFRLGARLGSAFGLLVVLTALLGGSAITLFSHINANTTDVATNWPPGIQHIGELRDDLNEFRRHEALHLISQDPSTKAAAEASLATIKLKLDAKRLQVQALADTADERLALRQLTEGLDVYYGLNTQLLALSRAGVDQAAESERYYTKVCSPMFRSLLQTAGKLLALNAQGASTAYLEAQAAYAAAKLWLWPSVCWPA